MDLALLAIAGIVTVVGVAAFAKQLGVAAPLILVVVGIGYSFLSAEPFPEIPPDWILMGVLPALLYAAAVQVPLVDFRRNLRAIGGLSIGLVVITAFGTGFLLYAILPDLDLGAAIALGAVISPTDAVAATSIGKKLGMPPRLVTVLEGESLVNDASALVLLRSAIAATGLASEFNFGAALGTFAYSAALAIVVGLVIGFLSVRVRAKLKDPMLSTAISFVVPFAAYIPAEHFGASGVLAVVVAGIYAGHNGARYFDAPARISDRLNWRTVQFVLENGVFLIMGLQLRKIVENVNDDPANLPLWPAIALGLLVTAAVIVLRFLFVPPLLLIIRRDLRRNARQISRLRLAIDRVRSIGGDSPRGTSRKERAEQVYERRTNDLEHLKSEGIGWRGGIVLSWAGMRGVVTLAAAQSLPDDTPYRYQLVLIAFVVAITTLLLQGSTLPFLIRLSGIRGSDKTADREELVTLLEEIGKSGLEVLGDPDTELPSGGKVGKEVIERVRHDMELQLEVARERAEFGQGEDALDDSPHQQYRTLRQEVLAAERDALLEARSRGAYTSRVLARAQVILDTEESRLAQLDNG